MALVTIVGFPCSGKSTRASQLKQYFENRLKDESYTGPRLDVVIVDDESSHVPRSVYDGLSPFSHPIETDGLLVLTAR